MTNHSKIETLLHNFALGWRTADSNLLKSTWDREYALCSYIASENPQPIYGFAAISAYYDQALSVFPITSMEISNIKIDELTQDLAYAFCDISIGFKMGENEYLVHPRANFVLRRRGDDWSVIHYHESIKYELPE